MLLDILNTSLYNIPFTVDAVKGKSAVLKVNTAGVKKEDLEVSASKGKITVKIEDHYRSFRISEDYDANECVAKYNNGLLEITVPRKKTKTITID